MSCWPSSASVSRIGSKGAGSTGGSGTKEAAPGGTGCEVEEASSLTRLGEGAEVEGGRPGEESLGRVGAVFSESRVSLDILMTSCWSSPSL